MNVDRDYEIFADAMGAAWDVHKPLTDRALAAMFEQMEKYPLHVVVGAIHAHQSDPQRGQFPPKVADLIAQIEAHTPGMQRVSADEAWSMCPMSELDTCVWTEEIQEAYFSGAHSLLMDGDRIGARMAFKSAYERIVARNKAAGISAEWFVSEGQDQERKAPVINAAIARGLLSTEQANEWRNRLELAAPATMAPLLENLATKTTPQVRDEALAAMRKLLREEETKKRPGLTAEERALMESLDWEKILGTPGQERAA